MVIAHEEEPGAVEGGPASFDAFYEEGYAGVVRLAYVLTGRMAVAEELAQDAFLAAYRHWDRIAGYESPEGWIRRVVTNRCLSHGRRRGVEIRLLARLGRERPAEVHLPEAGEQLWAAVRALPRRQAQVLALVFLDDLSVADVAAALGCGEETVRTHLRRGRAALAERLELDGGDDDA